MINWEFLVSIGKLCKKLNYHDLSGKAGGSFVTANKINNLIDLSLSAMVSQNQSRWSTWMSIYDLWSQQKKSKVTKMLTSSFFCRKKNQKFSDSSWNLVCERTESIFLTCAEFISNIKKQIVQFWEQRSKWVYLARLLNFFRREIFDRKYRTATIFTCVVIIRNLANCFRGIREKMPNKWQIVAFSTKILTGKGTGRLPVIFSSEGSWGSFGSHPLGLSENDWLFYCHSSKRTCQLKQQQEYSMLSWMYINLNAEMNQIY